MVMVHGGPVGEAMCPVGEALPGVTPGSDDQDRNGNLPSLVACEMNMMFPAWEGSAEVDG